MKRFCCRKNGDLRTGLIALALFLGILGACSLLFKMQRPLDRVLVKVEHVFAAREPESKAEQKEEKKDPLPAPQNQPAAAPSELSPALRVDASEGAQEGKEEPRRMEGKEEWDAPAPMTAAAMRHAEESPATLAQEKLETPGEIQVAAVQTTATETSSKPRNQAESQEPLPAGLVETSRQEMRITVSNEKYLSLFRHWQRSGQIEVQSKETIPLSVLNLERTYDLLQMKPVAVSNGTIFTDLRDGSRLPAQSLEEYSSTVFLVEDPWRKWEQALRKVGFRETDSVEVRYYMHEFTRAAIYTRANAAFSWCRESGKIPKESKAADVHVLGKTFTVNREGGGRFGVFVPVSLQTPDGGSVAVDPSCFAGQPDVEMLQAAGLL
jgi:hypothetical protein